MIIIDSTNRVIFTFALLLGFFMPTSNIIGQIIIGLLPIVLFILLVDKKTFYFNNYAVAIVLVIFFSLNINIFIGESIEPKSLLRFFSFSALFILFPFCQNVRISNQILYIILFIIVLSQLTYVLGISPLVKFFNTYFPYEGDTVGLTSDYLLQSARDVNAIVNRRYGGIYHNPNQAVRYVSILFLVFLIENRKERFIKLLPFTLFVLLSIVLSGSRTGFVVIIALLTGQYFILKETKYRFSLIVITLISILVLFLVMAFIQSSSLNLRIFDIGRGIEGSLGSKIDWFTDFFNQLNSVVRLLFGHFSTDNIQQKYGIPLLDSEWGELFYNFGIIGFAAVGMFFINLFRTKDRILNFFLLILLWGVSSTILFSFRMSFLFMLLLSNYYSLFLVSGNSQNNVEE